MHFFMAIIWVEGSGGEGFFTKAALESSDFLINAFYVVMTFSMEFFVSTVRTRAGFRKIAHKESRLSKVCT